MGRRTVLTVTLIAVVMALVPAAALDVRSSRRPPSTSIAVLGDTPYGASQRRQFPALVRDVNSTRRVTLVLHAGDIKSGGSRCSNARFADLARLFNTFDDPFVLTPGDNEWTDCHRASAGRFLPTERLRAVRRVFYPRPGFTTGGRGLRVSAQARERGFRGYLENVRFVRAGVVFATMHVVGSGNGLQPWSGLRGGDRSTRRMVEFRSRQRAAQNWIRLAFSVAQQGDAAGVALVMQAEPTNSSGFRRVRAVVLNQARRFDGPVLLIHGDEHVYEAERRYGGVRNLTRLETYGATASHWLELRVRPRTRWVFSWKSHTLR